MSTSGVEPIVQTRACVRVAPLLPLLRADALSTEEMTLVQEHLAACRWCQREIAAYDALDAALRRYAAAQFTPFTLEEIMQAGQAPSVESTPLRGMRPGRLSRRPKLPLLGALAAVLVVGFLVGTLVWRQATSSGINTLPTATPAVTATPTFSVDQLVGLSWTITELDVDGISYSLPHRVPTLHFYPGTGTIGGSGVCSPYYANYSLTGQTLRLSNIGVSEYIDCASDFEYEFLVAALPRIGRIQVQGSMLTMTSNDYRVRIIFQLS